MATYCSSDKLAVRDSLDDDDLSDVDDEVFIRDGKNGSKLLEDRGVKRPLMAPRRKVCKEGMRIRKPTCKIRCAFYCYALIALTVLLGLIILTVLLVSLYPLPLGRLRTWFSSRHYKSSKVDFIQPCSAIQIINVWNVTFPRLVSESPIRTADLNQDNIEDIIFGYRTENGPMPFPFLCPLYFSNQSPCQGGLLALDGRNGLVLWQHWTSQSIYFLDCSADMNGDKISDCIIMGERGLFHAINGHDGSVLWELPKIKNQLPLNIYTGQIIPDQNGDGVVDILVTHTLQKDTTRTGHVVLISGKTGSEIVQIPTPENAETYYMPQLLIRKINNTAEKNTTDEQLGISINVLIGTGGQDSPGALYVIPLSGFSTGKKDLMKPTLIYKDKNKGFLQPAVLVDITGDTIDDIIISTFNGTVLAFNGLNYKQIWNYTKPNSEILSALIPGYFNDDNVTDFMIKFNIGTEFPEYYYSETIILNGKTGKSILQESLKESGVSPLAGLSLSFDDKSTDMFLYWVADCQQSINRTFDKFQFMTSSTVWERNRADICNLRYNSTLILKLYALNQYISPPGILIYSTVNNSDIYNDTLDPITQAKKFFEDHPDHKFFKTRPEIYKNTKTQDGKSSFRHKGNGEGLFKDFSKNNYAKHPHGTSQHKHVEGDEVTEPKEQTWPDEMYGPDPFSILPEPVPDEDTYEDENMDTSYLNRDPRSGYNPLQFIKRNNPDLVDLNMSEPQKVLGEKELLNELNNYNEYRTVQNAKSRLLHDLTDVPSDILKNSYVENAEKELQRIYNQKIKMESFSSNPRNKFQQRDLRYKQNDRTSVKKELESMYKNLKGESLWDLESEKEQYDKKHGYWREKREMGNGLKGVFKVDGTGVLLKPLSVNDNSIDFVFSTYWLPVHEDTKVLLPVDKKCIENRFKKSESPDDKYHNLEKLSLQDLFTKLCLDERAILLDEKKIPPVGNANIDDSPYLKNLSRISFGQLTINRINIKCSCGALKSGEKCSTFLSMADQRWPEYLGKYGKGYFQTTNV